MAAPVITQDEVTIRFAGDSGDGMQLTGSLFTNVTALKGNDLRTLPEFPAEIRAPAGTLAGVSSFQLHFGSKKILTPGDECDVLVAMNAAALKSNLKYLKQGGIIIANRGGFNKKNLNLAHYEENPLENNSLDAYSVLDVDITRLTKEALKDTDLNTQDVERSKNMFVLGLLYWMYSRPMDSTLNFLEKKFAKKPELADANIKALKAGYHFGEHTEQFTSRYNVEAADLPPGKYRNISGNWATVLGLVTAAQKSGLELFYGSYPITPASDILHGLASVKEYGVLTFQAEDEIAAATSCIGAAFGGKLAVTGSSGPGIALKGEAIGLATILELPMVIMNIQRSGPSTGMPTKTEQADLMQALYGRNGESPVAVVAPKSPADCFNMAYEAARIALTHMIPVMMLSDGYLANGSEPWKFPSVDDIDEIPIQFQPPREDGEGEEPFLPYYRDEKQVRPWALPGTKGLEHRIGGLEKEHLTGNVSYDPDNHEKMTTIREEKRGYIADNIPLQEVEEGTEDSEIAVVGWGSTFGSIRRAVHELRMEGMDVAQVHLQYISPFPKNLGELLHKFKTVIVAEINRGQLIQLLNHQLDVSAEPINKMKGRPFNVNELKDSITEIVSRKKAEEQEV